MTFDPEKDGIDHINIYSKGKTRLGRLLSNFADTPFEIPGKGRFRTVEGFWYYTITGNNVFRNLPGWECKQIGSKGVPIRDHPTTEELYEAYRHKLGSHPNIKELLINNKLPLAHYYNYKGKVVIPKEWQWTAELWEAFK